MRPRKDIYSDGILGSTKIVPVLTYCICFVWEEKLPNIARHLFEFFFNKTHLSTTTFYCIEMTIYYTPYNIIHSRQKLASDRYLQHFFHICSDPAPCLQPFFHTPSPAYDILGCTTDPPIQSKLEQPLGLFMLFIYRYIYVLAIHFLGYHIFYYFFSDGELLEEILFVNRNVPRRNIIELVQSNVTYIPGTTWRELNNVMPMRSGAASASGATVAVSGASDMDE